MEDRHIEAFKKMRDICDDIVKAHECGDEKQQEAAMGRFILLMIQLEAMK